jgi:hypothetical protein
MARGSIYVESVIDADMASVWAATQDPREHVRWDLRFSSIEPIGAPGARAEHFTYTRQVPFHTVRGVGVNIGEISRPDGSRTSALRFSTDDRLSPIRSGRGYWRYIPTPEGVRFVTGYDYESGWGPLDLLVRPLLGWATAWSFDRMRIWLEGGPAPETWRLLDVLSVWKPGRPRAGRCVRAPAGGVKRANYLANAPATLATLPDPKEST